LEGHSARAKRDFACFSFTAPDARRLWNDRKASKPNTDYTEFTQIFTERVFRPGRGCRCVRAGVGRDLDPAIAARAIGRTGGGPQRASADRAAADLSPREIEVLRVTAIGHSNKAIANTLGIGVKSVDTYKARAMEKLGFRSRVEVIQLR
jgi:DNA-binding CsgD family transcriptional regulator